MTYIPTGPYDAQFSEGWVNAPEVRLTKDGKEVLLLGVFGHAPQSVWDGLNGTVDKLADDGYVVHSAMLQNTLNSQTLFTKVVALLNNLMRSGGDLAVSLKSGFNPKAPIQQYGLEAAELSNRLPLKFQFSLLKLLALFTIMEKNLPEDRKQVFAYKTLAHTGLPKAKKAADAVFDYIGEIRNRRQFDAHRMEQADKTVALTEVARFADLIPLFEADGWTVEVEGVRPWMDVAAINLLVNELEARQK